VPAQRQVHWRVQGVATVTADDEVYTFDGQARVSFEEDPNAVITKSFRIKVFLTHALDQQCLQSI